MKRISDGRKHIVPIPPVVEPVEIEVALAAILVQHQDIPVAVRILHVRASCHLRHCPLSTLRAVSYARHHKSADSLHQVASFLRNRSMTLKKGMPVSILHTAISEFDRLKP